MERLSGMDAFFLYVESPTQHMHVTLCAVLDATDMPGGFSFDAVHDHIAGRIHLIPPFTRRLIPVPLNVHHPLWLDDPDFDVDYHLRRSSLAAPGNDSQLGELTAQIAGLPLDRTRPLWEMWIVDGLADNRFALIAKLHHSTLDGVAGVEQLITLFDLDRVGREIEPPAPRHVDEIPSDFELLAFATVSKAMGVLDIVPLVRSTAGSVLAVRRTRIQRTASPKANQPDGGTPLAAPRSRLNGTITAQRHVGFARVSLDDVKKTKSLVPEATVNDVILAICTGALRRYLIIHEDLPDDPLVAACPIDVRTQEHQGRSDNRISAMFVTLPTQVRDPIERLEQTHLSARAAKGEHALFESDTLQQWAEIADPNLFRRLSGLYASSGLAGRHRPAINVMISNLPGPPFSLFMAGAELVRAYPMGQIIEGVGLNITVMSYRDSIDFGFMAAANLLPDIQELADEVAPAFAELTALLAQPEPVVAPAAVTKPPRKPRPKPKPKAPAASA